MKRTLFTSLIILCTFSLGFAQTDSTEENETGSPFSLSADFVSRYVWRGLLFNASPNIQPTLDFSLGNLSVGAWGSYGISDKFAEVDLYLSYTVKYFTLTVFDYYTEDETDLSLNSYFKWGKTNTPHSLEASLSFNGTEKLPLTFTASTFFYGNDWDINGNNYYSTYFEVGYYKQIGTTQLNLFAGGTPASGLYSDRAGFVNVGIKLSKDIVVSDKYNLPVFGQLILNPNAKDIFFVFGLTL